MHKAPRGIETNQQGIHQHLLKTVAKYLRVESKKPIAAHSQVAFKAFKQWLGPWNGEIIFDSCCGVGESTAYIAHQHPHAKVIGIDKSVARLDKHHAYAQSVDNYLLLRAELNDFWRLAVLDGIKLYKHYLLYPNPYPKSAQLQSRWYASSAFPHILALGGLLEVRSNWQLYIEEFSEALKYVIHSVQAQAFTAPQAITPFERKYWESGQQSWQLQVNLDKE
ncbi:MAG: SAM-dependent methyltransferase [Paraglaciecola sp.]|nr:SAM-dependent methyltransferase [Paraglaciecola sp.]NCT47349.1 SAM-dependent methyltransferase [Paraglaciecola sp.]